MLDVHRWNGKSEVIVLIVPDLYTPVNPTVESRILPL
jgi:hypothetical protein